MSTPRRRSVLFPGGGVQGVLSDANYDRRPYETVAREVSGNGEGPGKGEKRV